MSIAIQILQVSGIIGVSLAAGSNIATSLISIPPFLKSPPRLLATQWKEMYELGKTFVPPLAVGSTLAFGILTYLAMQRNDSHEQPTVLAYASAAVLSFSLVPYTLLVLGSTNASLLSIAAGILKQDTDGSLSNAQPTADVTALVRHWSFLNLGRGVLLLGGAVAGIYGTLINGKL